MFHVKQFILVLITFVSFTQCKSQGSIRMSDNIISYNLPEDKGLRSAISATQGFKSMSKEEQDVVYYMDYARKNPSVFLDKAINVFIDGHPDVKSSYTKSLQKEFAVLTPLPIMYIDTNISRVSKEHAIDLKANNEISHNSSNGASFQERVGKVIKGCGGEAIHGSPRYTSLEAVLFLLFDFNVPSLGHRKSLLSTNYTKLGVGVSLSETGNSILVIDFSCQ